MPFYKAGFCNCTRLLKRVRFVVDKSEGVIHPSCPKSQISSPKDSIKSLRTLVTVSGTEICSSDWLVAANSNRQITFVQFIEPKDLATEALLPGTEVLH